MAAGATYEPIATSSLAGVSSVTFSSISGSYTDLKIVISGRTTTSTASLGMQFNGNTASNYSQTDLYGNGTTASSGRLTSQTYFYLGQLATFSTTPSLWIVDIFSYAGSTNKTCVWSIAADLNGSGSVERSVGLWRQTSAITSIKLDFFAVNLNSGQATLYGIKNSA